MLRVDWGLIAAYSIIVPLVIGGMRYRLFDKALKISYRYLFVATAGNLTAIIAGHIFHNNLPFLHLYTAIEFVVLCIYIQALPLSPITAMQAKVMIGAFLVFCVVNAIWFESLTSFNAYPLSIEALTIALLILIYFNKELKQLHIISWKNNPYSWINFGLLIYFASSFVLFVFSNVLLVKTAHSVLRIMWAFHSIVVIIMYQFFAIGYSKCKA